MDHPELCLFALDATRDFGEQVAQHLGVALSPHEEREFEDGEHKTRSLANVRGRDVFVVQSLYGDGAQSVHDKSKAAKWWSCRRTRAASNAASASASA
jgi:ribose-phosphate pyrophosphokinase